MNGTLAGRTKWTTVSLIHARIATSEMQDNGLTQPTPCYPPLWLQMSADSMTILWPGG